jgi:hypothetical protein
MFVGCILVISGEPVWVCACGPPPVPLIVSRPRRPVIPALRAGQLPGRRPVAPPLSISSDTGAQNCTACDKPFTLFRRRHHCRFCGKVIASNLTVSTHPLSTPLDPTQPSLVHHCTAILAPSLSEVVPV